MTRFTTSPAVGIPSEARRCTACRGCHLDTCHVGIATQVETPEEASRRGLKRFVPRVLENGIVYETTLDAHPGIGSICSGGRYDDLAGQYTTTRLPGVGLSIGFTRLFGQAEADRRGEDLPRRGQARSG